MQFFDKDLATQVMHLDEWMSNYRVDLNALEEVQPAFITYGHRDRENRSSSLSGWSSSDNKDPGSHFYFTIHFPSSKFREYDEFANGRIVRGMMDKIQSEINRFYEQFNTQDHD